MRPLLLCQAKLGNCEGMPAVVEYANTESDAVHSIVQGAIYSVLCDAIPFTRVADALVRASNSAAATAWKGTAI